MHIWRLLPTYSDLNHTGPRTMHIWRLLPTYSDLDHTGPGAFGHCMCSRVEHSTHTIGSTTDIVVQSLDACLDGASSLP